jgi:hypothetical protein
MISVKNVARAAVALLVMAALCGMENEAAGEQIVLTLEAYAPSTLPVRSTTLEVADIHDQLEISRQAALFAISDSGWNLGAVGGQLHSLPTPEVSAWVWGIRNILPSMDGNLAQRMGYDLNAEAVANPGPNGPEYFLWFHTDAWAERLSHNWGEEPNNFGSIAGCTGGVWFQCPVPHWGSFSVEPVPEPATLTLLLIGGAIALCRKKRGKTLRALCLAFALLALAPAFALAGPNFGPPIRYLVSGGPSNVIAADLNGDGRLDLATANYYGSTVSVLYSLGGRAFAPATDLYVGDNPYGLATADLDRDGRPDIVFTTYWNSSVGWLLNQGSGDFSAPRYREAGAKPHDIAVGDFNHDGLVDVAVGYGDAATGKGAIAILHGDGQGGLDRFLPHYQLEGIPADMLTWDRNRDGLADLATPIHISPGGVDGVALLDGMPNGTMSDSGMIITGGGAHYLASGDFNRDGWPDLAVSNYWDADITLLFGDATGHLGGAKEYNFGRRPMGIATADFNGDGILDLAAARYGVGVDVLYGDGHGDFDFSCEYPVFYAADDVLATDLDGDGFTDIVVSNGGADSVTVLYNAMPEPATLALLIVGGLALLGRRSA